MILKLNFTFVGKKISLIYFALKLSFHTEEQFKSRQKMHKNAKCSGADTKQNIDNEYDSGFAIGD